MDPGTAQAARVTLPLRGGRRVTDTDGRPRVGRPPRISRQMIAEAAHDLGLDGLTMRSVADRLGVSIPALYHHVAGKDDLMRLAAEYSATRVPVPADHGQHWALWLLEWATYNRDAFVADPGLLGQYLEGAVPAEAIAGTVDAILGVLTRQGFTVVEAAAACELVSSCALGTAVGTIREREAAQAGRAVAASHRRVLAAGGPDELPHLRALLDAFAAGAERQSFHDRVATVLCGVALRQGLDWAPIGELLAAAAPAPAENRRRRPAGSRRR